LYNGKFFLIHRQLKPDNILVDQNKIIKFVDFGLSNTFDLGQSSFLTPPCFYAPEVILGKKYSGLPVDIWSLGVILYYMICGILPFEV
jgi:serine/threonine protein kinase